MPELPDVAAYIAALEPRILGRKLERARVTNVALLRTSSPPLNAVEGRAVCEIRRVGKRIAIGLEGDLWLVLHLMIAGRLHWRPRDAKLGSRNALASFDFPNGSLVLTEAGSKRRASLHVVQGREAVGAIDRGGVDVLASTLNEFVTVLSAENRTLKRALTDPRAIDGIGNAYLRDFTCSATLATGANAEAGPSGVGAPFQRNSRNAASLDRSLERGRRARVSGKGDGISRRYGGARSIRQALSALPPDDPADPLCR